MNKNWSLDALYTSYEDPKFINDLQSYKQLCDNYQNILDTLSHEDDIQSVKAIIKHMSAFSELGYRLFAYVKLRQSVNTIEPETASYLSQLSNISAKTSKTTASMQRFITEISDISSLLEDDELKEYQYFIQKIYDNRKYLLNNDVEEVLQKMDMSGGQGWEMLQSYLTSTLETTFQGRNITLSELRNMAYEKDESLRKQAYDAELKAYDTIKGSVAFALNHIKQQVNTECELRGFSSPLDMTLYQSNMKKETLTALLSAIEDYLPVFWKYLRRKAELLHHKNGLPWYDLFAPIGEVNQTFTLEEAKSYLIKHFTPFAKDLADMIETAFDDAWIDFYPKKGKVSGAFCYNLPMLKESRILTNFDGSLSDVVTLAHELGHAYHGKMIENHKILNTDYSMPVAETASTFNENIIMNAAIADADKISKITLIESQLQDITQTICDIYSRFLFEEEVFKRRNETFLFPEDLENIMIEAQKKAYGDGLDHNYLHPYMWVCKGHYYSSTLSYYNFPYAFGGLFARGLFVKYEELKDEFPQRYRQLLHATTISDVEDVAKLMDIDLTSKEFWVSSLETVKQSIDEFLTLTE